MTQSDKMTSEQMLETLQRVREMLISVGTAFVEHSDENFGPLKRAFDDLRLGVDKPATPEYVPATVRAKVRFTVPISYPDGKGPSKAELRDAADSLFRFFHASRPLYLYGVDQLDPSDVKVTLIED